MLSGQGSRFPGGIDFCCYEGSRWPSHSMDMVTSAMVGGATGAVGTSNVMTLTSACPPFITVDWHDYNNG